MSSVASNGSVLSDQAELVRFVKLVLLHRSLVKDKRTDKEDSALAEFGQTSGPLWDTVENRARAGTRWKDCVAGLDFTQLERAERGCASTLRALSSTELGGLAFRSVHALDPLFAVKKQPYKAEPFKSEFKRLQEEFKSLLAAAVSIAKVTALVDVEARLHVLRAQASAEGAEPEVWPSGQSVDRFSTWKVWNTKGWETRSLARQRSWEADYDYSRISPRRAEMYRLKLR